MSDVKDIAPDLKEVLADRGFTQLTDTFNRGIHRLCLDLVMDYKDDARHVKMRLLTGSRFRDRARQQSLWLIAGSLFPNGRTRIPRPHLAIQDYGPVDLVRE